jgi:hypothetical protein
MRRKSYRLCQLPIRDDHRWVSLAANGSTKTFATSRAKVVPVRILRVATDFRYQNTGITQVQRNTQILSISDTDMNSAAAAKLAFRALRLDGAATHKDCFEAVVT